MEPLNLRKKWVFALVISSLICVLVIATSINMGLVSSMQNMGLVSSMQNMGLVSSMQRINSLFSNFPSLVPVNETDSVFVKSIPRLAYLVSGSKGDLEKLWRTLRVLYHPLNLYIVHLDLESSMEERVELASRIENDTIYAKVGNVHIITKANMVTYRGPTMVSNTLHACAILLKKSKDWDWFINLSASDYPLMTQDDILFAFSSLNRSLNFIEHTSWLRWKEDHRAKPLIIDPGLYKSNKSDIFFATQKREMPTAFKLFTGSAWMVLSRAFVEYCVWGWDNLPRTLLMYYTNFVTSAEGYFQTVICNVPEFAQTTINHDLHYISWPSKPPRQHPRTLNVNDTTNMIRSNAPFARKFKQDDPVLDKIDTELLNRKSGSFVQGGWCSGNPPCSELGDPTRLKPGLGATKLATLMSWIVFSPKSRENQCR